MKSRYDPTSRRARGPDSGAYKSYTQSSPTVSRPILGTSGKDFLRRLDKADGPQNTQTNTGAKSTKEPQQTPQASTTLPPKPRPVVASGESRPSQMAQGNPVVKKARTTQPASSSTAGTPGTTTQPAPSSRDGTSGHDSVMKSFLSFAPESLRPQIGGKTPPVLPSNNIQPSRATSKPEARPEPQPPVEVPSGSLMDIDSPEQTQGTGIVGLDQFQPLTAEQKPSSTSNTQLPGLGASRFASNQSGHAGGQQFAPPNSNSQVPVGSGGFHIQTNSYQATGPHPSTGGINHPQGEQKPHVEAGNSASTPQNPSGTGDSSYAQSSSAFTPNQRATGPAPGLPGSGPLGTSFLIQTGSSSGQLHTVTQVHSTNGFLVLGHTQGQLMMQTPVGAIDATTFIKYGIPPGPASPTHGLGMYQQNYAAVPQSSASKENNPPSSTNGSKAKATKGLSHSMWA